MSLRTKVALIVAAVVFAYASLDFLVGHGARGAHRGSPVARGGELLYRGFDPHVTQVVDAGVPNRNFQVRSEA